VRITLGVVMAAAALAAAAVAFSTPGAEAGAMGELRGATFLGPLCGGEPRDSGARRPSCRRDYRVVAARIRIVPVDPAGRSRIVRSGADGRFSAELRPGTYDIAPVRVRGTSGAPGPRRIESRAGETLDVIIDYSTGVSR
jgi:hypothetical protein